MSMIGDFSAGYANGLLDILLALKDEDSYCAQAWH